MVMEAPPSPDSVGREFVRQYYTLLHQAPTHLHRFYNNQSSFVHGGLDPPNRETSPMIGQKQIHQKIQQLNFRDCHAKISQVDAQATLGNGVVVQVTGELSNAGQPMRRFTQTFVLAAQSPKKYYVHNDIFRYQDEIISDEECENETAHSDGGDEEVVVVQQQQQHPVPEQQQQQPPPQRPSVVNEIGALTGPPPQQQQSVPYYGASMPPVSHLHSQVGGHVVPPPQQPQQQPPPQQQQPQQQPPPQQAMAPVINGAVHPDELNVLSHRATAQPPTLGSPPAISNAALQPALNQVVSSPQNVPVAVEDLPPPIEEQPVADNMDFPDPPPAEELEILAEPTSNEPKTYATLLKSGGGSIGYSSIAQINSSPAAPPKALSPPPQNRYDNREAQSGGLGNMNQQRRNDNRNPRPGQHRVPRQDSQRGGAPLRASITEDGGDNFEERRRSQANTDPYQLFLGNLPHSATEDELRELFSQFGVIVDLRIHGKPNVKPMPGVRPTPNFGFITFETNDAVRMCLGSRPIYFPPNDKNAVPLNVEQKIKKERIPYGSGGGGGGMGRTGPDSMSGGPRDSTGPRSRPSGGASGPGGARPSGPGQVAGGAGGGGGGSGGGGPNRANGFNRGGGQGAGQSRMGGPNNNNNNGAFRR